MTSPAETLRSAATLMRDRAQAATPGPWKAHGQHGDWYVSSPAFGQVSTGINEEPSLPEFLMIERDRRDAEYIASMHPLLGMALTEWLEAAAALIDAQVFPEREPEMEKYPLAVARIILGETEGAGR